MKKIKLKNGYVTCPDDFIELPFLAVSEECEYVGVVSTQSAIYKDIPRFVFFSQIPILRITDLEKELVLSLCEVFYPPLKEIRQRESLSVGVFGVLDSTDDTTFPMDVKIVREED